MADKNTPVKRGRKGGRKPILELAPVAAALAQERGNVAAVARRFKVDRSPVRKFIDRHPTLIQILSDAREGMLDTAESSLYTAVEKGEAWAVCFFLKTQGRSRGYLENAILAELQAKLDKMNDQLSEYVKRGGTPA